MNRIALFGAGGMLGRRLAESLGNRAILLDRDQLDLTQHDAIVPYLEKLKPDAIINASGYTDVERSEDERDLAFSLNAEAPLSMAQFATRANIPLIHFSTDYVFDGTKQGAYVETDPTAPLSAYGKSKEAGEHAALTCPNAIVLRISWLYDIAGKNFFTTIANKAREVKELRIVADQIGAPCFARDIARCATLLLDELPKCPYRGIVHMTNAGETSWHGFARAITDAMRKHESLPLDRIEAIPSEAYPTKARRPKNSRLNNALLAREFAIALPTWQDALTRCMEEFYARR